MTMLTVARWPFVLALMVLTAAMPASRGQAQSQDCEYGAFGCGHTEQHHQYRDWKPRTGNGNCCNDDDCRPVRARQEDDGAWSVWIPEFRCWVPVPAYAVGDPDRFGDGRSRVCSFSPTGSKS